MNLNFPSKLNAATSIKDALVFMEPFWDSGVPRFGEKNAPGWSSCVGTSAPTIATDAALSDFSDEENVIVQNGTELAEVWLKLEQFREAHYLLPYHGTDDLLDPERMVLLDDVRPFLFRFQRNAAHEHLFVIGISNFLTLLHCPMLRNFSTESYGWQAGMVSLLEAPLTNLFAYWSESHFCAVAPDSYCYNLFSPYETTWTEQVRLYFFSGRIEIFVRVQGRFDVLID